ncbi:MAG: hypothetical protein FWG88_07105 [Oscillospiraceae bacterium]|nr:hypothetical protein [Oscillospiraceae bacterium]
MEEHALESIFENQYIRTKEFFAEFYRWAYIKNPSYVVVHSIWFAYFLFGIFTYIYFDSVKLSQRVMIPILPFIFWFFLILRIIRHTKIQYKRDLEVNQGSPIEFMYIINEEAILMLSI